MIFDNSKTISFDLKFPGASMLRLTCLVILVALFTFNRPLLSFQQGTDSQDHRLGNLRDLNSYFPFDPPETKKQWEKRAERVRTDLLVSQGLWPMPTKTPLNAVIHGTKDMGEYTVEKVYFESFPGFHVTGSLYRPKKQNGKAVGVLCPHGHHRDGRFRNANDAEIANEIKSGAENFKSNAKSPLQARCVHLARMGCVVFHYDMLGYADSQQISYDLAHRFATQRPDMNTAENWGLFSPRAVNHLQSIMGLQTWNSIRAMDFLSSLPDVDPERIGVTGASGGGTQTFMLCALDNRPAVSMPVVMVSTAMQGGCTCENCANLRIDTGNVEIAALFAPKPMGLVSADDWTKEIASKGFPELQKLYEMLGKPKNVMLHNRIEFPHNYNQVSREAMYGWFNKHFELDGPLEEKEIKFLTREQLTVYDDEHPRPVGGEALERELLKHWFADSQSKMAVALEKNRPDEFLNIVETGTRSIIGRGESDYSEQITVSTPKAEGFRDLQFDIAQFKERVMCIEFAPKLTSSREKVILYLGENGIGTFEEEEERNQFAKYAEEGYMVVMADLIGQGKNNRIEQSRWVNNSRQAAGYAFGYNHTLFKQRVHDVMSIAIGLKREGTKQITLVSEDKTSAIAVAAATQLDSVVDNLIVRTSGFRFHDVDNLRDAYFLPGGAKYGDIPGMLTLCNKMNLYIAGEQFQNLGLLMQFKEAQKSGGELIIANPKNSDAFNVLTILEKFKK